MDEVNLPRVVLICHQDDEIDMKGISAWLGCSFDLLGMVVIQERALSRWRRLRREFGRVGLMRTLDVIAFRLFYRLFLSKGHRVWVKEQVARLRARYPTELKVPWIVTETPNSGHVRHFLVSLKPDLVIARCKFILKPDIFDVPRFGTFVIHPGICPEYRNAHGCFWALVTRDLENVGMTLLKVDRGIDTGPIYLQRSCSFNETTESHTTIQYRVVLENLTTIERVLYAACQGRAEPIDIRGRASRNWGQPWLTAHMKWKRAATR